MPRNQQMTDVFFDLVVLPAVLVLSGVSAYRYATTVEPPVRVMLLSPVPPIETLLQRRF